MRTFLKDKKNKTIIITACIIAVIAIVAVIFIVVANKKEKPNIFDEKEIVKIECLGDSITYSSNGITYDQCKITYPGKLGEKLLNLFNNDSKTYKVKQIDVDNLGIPGDFVMPDRYLRLSGNADIVIMLYGINNVFQNQPYKGVIESNIEEIKKSGAKLYLLLYPLCPDGRYYDQAKKINDYILKVAKETKTELFDANEELSKLKNEKEYFEKDGIHFTPEGYELFAEIIAKRIYNDYKK